MSFFLTIGAGKAERGLWMNEVHLQGSGGVTDAHLLPLASVVEGNESPAFLKAVAV